MTYKYTAVPKLNVHKFIYATVRQPDPSQPESRLPPYNPGYNSNSATAPEAVLINNQSQSNAAQTQSQKNFLMENILSIACYAFWIFFHLVSTVTNCVSLNSLLEPQSYIPRTRNFADSNSTALSITYITSDCDITAKWAGVSILLDAIIFAFFVRSLLMQTKIYNGYPRLDIAVNVVFGIGVCLFAAFLVIHIIQFPQNACQSAINDSEIITKNLIFPSLIIKTIDCCLFIVYCVVSCMLMIPEAKADRTNQHAS